MCKLVEMKIGDSIPRKLLKIWFAMAYISFTIPNSTFKKYLRNQVIDAMTIWGIQNSVKFTVRNSGFQIDYMFLRQEDMTFFLLNPPTLAIGFTVVD